MYIVRSDRVREYALLTITVAGLSAATALQRFIIYPQVIVPATADGFTPAPWMWGVLFVPELLVCFAAGWRLRGPFAIVLYAVTAALHRTAWGAFGRAELPGHPASPSPLWVELVAATVLYLAVFWVASASARTPGFVPAADD